MAGVKGKSGGARVGAGRKPRAAAAQWLSGAKHGPRMRPAAPSVPSGPVVKPKSLRGAAAKVWAELAPHAIAEGKLTERTAAAFAILCQLVAAERLLWASPAALGPDHRGTLQRIEAGFARFRLTGDGRPVEPVVVEDEWTPFDVIQGGKG